MKKNLFEVAAKNEVTERSRRLSANQQPLWGTLTAAEMLRHCSEVLKGTMAHYATTQRETLKQKISRFVMLNFVPRFPKGAKTPDRVNIKKNNITVNDLATEQEQFARLVNKFVSFTGPITLFHPYFGYLNHRQWGILTWMHMDHHLRQFGV